MLKQKYIETLSSKFRFRRLKSIKKLKEIALPQINKGLKRESVNILIHTNCSFSPYTPSLAAYMSSKFGLGVAGIMDNYTLNGAREFSKACIILGITYTVGVEIRTNITFNESKGSNVAVCGIAARYFDSLQRDLQPLRENQRQNSLNSLEAVNHKLKKYGIQLDFKNDVLNNIPCAKDRVYLSKYVYKALGEKLIEKYKKGPALAEFLITSLGMELTETEKGLLSDSKNPYYTFDLTNIIFENCNVFIAKKSYIEPNKVVELAHKYGSICAYELLLRNRIEDVESKEFSEILKLFKNLKDMGFDAVAFDGNKTAQSVRDKMLEVLHDYEMLPLALSKIEFPRRKFDVSFPDETCQKVMTDSSYAIVGSEMCENLTGDGFLRCSNLKINSFDEKVQLFAKIGRKGG